MRNLFNLDSPLMSFLTKLFNLMLLNLLTLVCCIPVFTIGASLTAMNTVALKIVKDRETSIAKEFFLAFKENFKQGTLIWLIYLIVILVVAADFWIIYSGVVTIPQPIAILVTVLAVVVLMSMIYTFALLAHYENTIKNTIKNAWLLSIANLPRTVLMLMFIVIWCVALYAFIYQLLPLIILFGVSVPAWFVMWQMNKIFIKLDGEDDSTSTAA